MKRKKLILPALALLCATLAGVTNNATADELPGLAVQPTSYFYTGKPYDEDMEGYLFRFRTYQPEVNRWTTIDPSGFPDGANGMRYAPAPTVGLDPAGLSLIYGASVGQRAQQAINHDLTNAMQGRYKEAAQHLVNWASQTNTVAIRIELMSDAQWRQLGFPGATTSALDFSTHPFDDTNFNDVSSIAVWGSPTGLEIIYGRLSRGSVVNRSSIYAESMLHELLHVWAAAAAAGKIHAEDYAQLSGVFAGTQFSVDNFKTTAGWEQIVGKWSTALRATIYE